MRLQFIHVLVQVLSKKEVIDRQEVAHTVSEMRILRRLKHPFIISLHFAFQSPSRLFLVRLPCSVRVGGTVSDDAALLLPFPRIGWSVGVCARG